MSITCKYVYIYKKKKKKMNRVIEIQGFTSKQQWYYIKSKNMIADIGTRKGATSKYVNQSSTWINGVSWMQLDATKFPMKAIEDLKLKKSQLCEVQKEHNIEVHCNMLNDKILEEVKKMYQFSQSLIDPNLHTFKSVVRIMVLVMKFCRILTSRLKELNDKQSIYLSDDSIRSAEIYYYKIVPQKLNISCHRRNMRSLQRRKMNYFCTQAEPFLTIKYQWLAVLLM